MQCGQASVALIDSTLPLPTQIRQSGACRAGDSTPDCGATLHCWANKKIRGRIQGKGRTPSGILDPESMAAALVLATRLVWRPWSVPCLPLEWDFRPSLAGLRAPSHAETGTCCLLHFRHSFCFPVALWRSGSRIRPAWEKAEGQVHCRRAESFTTLCNHFRPFVDLHTFHLLVTWRAIWHAPLDRATMRRGPRPGQHSKWPFRLARSPPFFTPLGIPAPVMYRWERDEMLASEKLWARHPTPLIGLPAYMSSPMSPRRVGSRYRGSCVADDLNGKENGRGSKCRLRKGN